MCKQCRKERIRLALCQMVNTDLQKRIVANTTLDKDDVNELLKILHYSTIKNPDLKSKLEDMYATKL